jgi:hypothetical protein
MGQNMAMRVISPQHVLLTSGTVVRFNNVGITGTRSLPLQKISRLVLRHCSYFLLLSILHRTESSVSTLDLIMRRIFDVISFFARLYAHEHTQIHTLTLTNTHLLLLEHSDVLEFESRRTLTELQIDDLVKLG